MRIVKWLAGVRQRLGQVQHGVFAARAILSYGGPYNRLGQNTDDEALLEARLADAKVRDHRSLEILDAELRWRGGWLVGGRPTIADICNFVYIALAPMGDILLRKYPEVRAWIARIRDLPGFVSIAGLDDPLVRRRNTKFEASTN